MSGCRIVGQSPESRRTAGERQALEDGWGRRSCRAEQQGDDAEGRTG